MTTHVFREHWKFAGGYAQRLTTRRFGDLSPAERQRVPGYEYGSDDSIVVYDGDWAIYLHDGTAQDAVHAAVVAAIEAESPIAGIYEPRFAAYQLPGGEQYREWLLTSAVPSDMEPDVPDVEDARVSARIDERRDAAGHRVLFIEDMRSEWSEAVPYAETSAWVLLAVKRLTAYAADRGIDRIALATGDMQVARSGIDESKAAGRTTCDAMRAFHDGMVRDAVTEWALPLGSSVEQVEIATGEPDPEPWKARDATDAGWGMIEASFATREEAVAWANENGGVDIGYEPGGFVVAHGFDVTPAMRAALVNDADLAMIEGSGVFVDEGTIAPVPSSGPRP